MVENESVENVAVVIENEHFCPFDLQGNVFPETPMIFVVHV